MATSILALKGSSSPRSLGDAELRALQRHGFAVSYRMLGSVVEAEDVTQEALLRLAREKDPIREPAAWVTTVVTRLSINALQSARARRETYVGPWLPEPLIDNGTLDPAARVEARDTLSIALLVLLERLTPPERAAYLLREVFGYGYADIAEPLGRTETSCRQLVARARRRLETVRPRFDADRASRDAVLERFLAAAEEGDVRSLEQMLAREAVLYADSDGRAPAPREPLAGAGLIARFMAAVAQGRRASGAFDEHRVDVNGQPGHVLRGPAVPPPAPAQRLAGERALSLLANPGTVDPDELSGLIALARDNPEGGASPRPLQDRPDRRALSVLTIDVLHARVQAIWVIRNPAKLAHLGAVTDRRAALSNG